ncbi:GHKL domain-containing protein [Schaalia sp. ZJ1691]|uniref:GHKL domain-containing protein n=1 Tax=Schaalia sp. ZJ1691 TaxID=2709404 RepID=UPI0013EC733D|nr:GHKL domain-containing protein [Schaalia sp. ZJ1691]
MVDVLPDIPRILTAIAEWSACVVYLSLYARTVQLWRLLTSVFGGLALLTAVQIIAGMLPVSLWIPGMISAVAAIALTLWVGTGCSPTQVAHLMLRAFILAEFIASLAWQLVVYFFYSPIPNDPGNPESLLRPVPFTMQLVIYAIILVIVRQLETRNFSGDTPFVLELRDLWTPFFITIITFTFSNLSFLTTATPFSGRLGPEIFYIRTLVDLVGFAALYAHHERVSQIRTALELRSIQSSLNAQHSQYLQSKADIEEISRAHHDLKHQIAVIRAELDPDSLASHFEQLEASINDIGQHYHSGNAVLDVILTAKGRTCTARGINFTVVADGALLTGMSSMDIATLFGNALDNAIEASAFVTDPAQRMIQVLLRRQGEMVLIRVANNFSGEISRNEDGSLATRKADRVHHGFGVKSIRYTARKYDGEVTTRFDGNRFILTVLLPGTQLSA